MSEMTNQEKRALREAVEGPADQFHPSLRQEDQDMADELLKPVVIGPPAYASPDPATNAGRLVPVEDHPLSGSIDKDFGKAAIEAGGVVSQPSSLAGTEDAPGGHMDSASSAGASMSDDELAEAKLLKAAEWKEMVEEAEDEGELDDVVSRYEAAGAGYSTVDSAIESKREELAGD